ncbi:hypothetical protein [Actinoplanes sp. NPDC026619]|uniref:hypothetical protein n=1 Tax=Actinoplanes sp. NPDC026619 TaxID=3155798 RepID=UPI0033F0E5BB
MSNATAHLDRARRVSAVDVPAAIALLRGFLERRNPYLTAVDPEIRDMAELFVRLSIDAATESAPAGWAAYLHRAALNLNGATAPRTQDATSLVIEFARRRRTPTAPDDLITIETGPAGGDSSAGREVTTRFAVANMLQSYGLCEAAGREAIAALFQWSLHHDDAPDLTYLYLAEALAVHVRCGRARESKSIVNAYGAMLPGPGTEGEAFLRSHITLKLDEREQTQRHALVCGIRRRRSCEDLRATILASFAA